MSRMRNWLWWNGMRSRTPHVSGWRKNKHDWPQNAKPRRHPSLWHRCARAPNRLPPDYIAIQLFALDQRQRLPRALVRSPLRRQRQRLPRALVRSLRL